MKNSIRELNEKELGCVTGGEGKQDKEREVSLGDTILNLIGTVIGIAFCGYIVDPFIDRIRDKVRGK